MPSDPLARLPPPLSAHGAAGDLSLFFSSSPSTRVPSNALWPTGAVASATQCSWGSWGPLSSLFLLPLDPRALRKPSQPLARLPRPLSADEVAGNFSLLFSSFPSTRVPSECPLTHWSDYLRPSVLMRHLGASLFSFPASPCGPPNALLPTSAVTSAPQC